MSLISTDGLESSLREILEAVARQSTELKNLRAEVSACATRADVSTVQREISARLSSVEARLDRLEAETHLDLPFDAALGIARESSEGGVVGASVDARVPLSRFVLAHDASLRALTRASELAATREELAASSRMASDALRDAGLRAAEDFASRSALDASAAAVSAQSAELAALQGVVATKVDRGEWAAVQAVAADVAGFGGFRAAAGAELRELGARSDEHRAALDRSLESTAKLSAVVQALAGATAQKADARELRGLSASVEHIAAELGRAASADDLRMASNALASVTARATALEAASREITRAAADDRRAVDARVQAAAASLRADIAGAAAKFEQQLESLREEVDARAYVTALEATDESVQEIRARVELESKKTDVALRFVDWYAEKGEAYDYNATALERHMNSLAVGNRSRTVDSAADLRSRVFGGDASGVLRAAYSTARDGPLTGSSGVRVGGVAPS